MYIYAHTHGHASVHQSTSTRSRTHARARTHTHIYIHTCTNKHALARTHAALPPAKKKNLEASHERSILIALGGNEKIHKHARYLFRGGDVEVGVKHLCVCVCVHVCV
jgi:hypothetical protein